MVDDYLTIYIHLPITWFHHQLLISIKGNHSFIYSSEIHHVTWIHHQNPAAWWLDPPVPCIIGRIAPAPGPGRRQVGTVGPGWAAQRTGKAGSTPGAVKRGEAPLRAGRSTAPETWGKDGGWRWYELMLVNWMVWSVGLIDNWQLFFPLVLANGWLVVQYFS